MADSDNENPPSGVQSTTGAAVRTAEDDNILIGTEVRFWRRERGMTGAKLAKGATITPGMLTKIE
ncbi:MAG: helix-turn-helix domain-containing protein [Pseudomonadota bacterium]